MAGTDTNDHLADDDWQTPDIIIGVPRINADVFLYERATGTVTLVSHIPGAPTTTGTPERPSRCRS